MQEGKAGLAFLGFVEMILLTMMGYYYVGIVNPSLLTPNVVNDFFAPLSFQYPEGIILGFIIFGCGIFLLAPAADMVIEGKKEFFKKHRYRILITFLVFVMGLLSVTSFTKFMFMLGFPICVIGFITTGFILKAIFQKSTADLKDDFKFEKCLHKIESPNNFIWQNVDQFLNIESFQSHTSIIGGPGAGKSYTFIEPFIEQAIAKGFALLVFDFKMNGNFSPDPTQWALTHYVYRSMLKYSKPALREKIEVKNPNGSVEMKDGPWKGDHSAANDRRRLYIINFRDVRYSHRCNPIHPMYLESEAFANEYAVTLLQNMKPEWVKQKDFFADNAILYFKGAMWWAKNEYDGKFCTLPHIMELVLHDYKRVLAVLSQNEDSKRIVTPIIVANKSKAAGQLAGVISTLQSAVQKATDPNIAWVTSGNDFNLRLNDPEDPGILCFGSDPELSETCGPISAMIAKVATKVMNQPGRLYSLAVLDELPRLAIPKLDETLATSRSNNFGFVLAGQDISQYNQIWTETQTDALLANCGNVIVGQTNNPKTKKEYSDMIGPREKNKVSTNTGKSMGDSLSKSSGENLSQQQENLIKPHEIGVLKRGEFFGKVAITNEKQPYDNFFRIAPKVPKINIKFKFPQILRDANGNEYPFINQDAQGRKLVIPKTVIKKRETNIRNLEENDPVKILVDNNQKTIREDVQLMLVKECLFYIKDHPEEEEDLFPTHFYLPPGKEEKVRIVEFDDELNCSPLYDGIKSYDYLDGAVIGVPDFNRPAAPPSAAA